MAEGTCRNQVDDSASNSLERKLVRVRIPSSPLRKWDDSAFIMAVESSKSIAQVLKALGLCPTGSNYQTVHKHVKRLDLSTAHWTGSTTNSGINHKGGIEKIPWESVLVLDRYHGLKTATDRLRRALIESGVPEECSSCGGGPSWNGKPLRLQIDHQNGNPVDNRPGNPRFLCPNCHTQTENFGALNIKGRKNPKPPVHRVPRKYVTKIEWPHRESMADMLQSMTMKSIAQKLGVSTTAVLKRCRTMGLKTSV